MVWFYCDDCGDSIKKPKLANHFRTCRGQTFTCVDCSRSFDRSSAAGHSTCVSEHEKYALGATKPGGFAAQGCFKDGKPQQQQQQGAAAGSDEVIGTQFLSERPPWKCSCCNVSCTSRDTLLGHAAGVKHKRRARAALGIAGQQQSAAAEKQPEQQPVVEAAPAAAADAPAAVAGSKRDSPDVDAASAGEPVPAQQQHSASKKYKKDKKEKKDKSKEKQCSTTEAAADLEVEAAANIEAAALKSKTSSKKPKKREKGAAAGDAAAAAEPSSASAAPAARPHQQDGPQPEPPKDKTSKKDKKRKEQQQQLPDVAPLLAVAQKKLKKKGKLRFKKLEALLRANANGGFSKEVVAAVREQLLAAAEVQLDGEDTLVWDAN